MTKLSDNNSFERDSDITKFLVFHISPWSRNENDRLGQYLSFCCSIYYFIVRSCRFYAVLHRFIWGICILGKQYSCLHFEVIRQLIKLRVICHYIICSIIKQPFWHWISYLTLLIIFLNLTFPVTVVGVNTYVPWVAELSPWNKTWSLQCEFLAVGEQGNPKSWKDTECPQFWDFIRGNCM